MLKYSEYSHKFDVFMVFDHISIFCELTSRFFDSNFWNYCEVKNKNHQRRRSRTGFSQIWILIKILEFKLLILRFFLLFINYFMMKFVRLFFSLYGHKKSAIVEIVRKVFEQKKTLKNVFISNHEIKKYVKATWHCFKNL